MPHYSRREFVKAAGLGAAGWMAPQIAGAAEASKRKPNVIFILADDLGWRDTSLYGSKFCETPNVERLAKRGVMFTQAYAANPLCSPTRASIMTGLWPARIGITAPACHQPEEIFESLLQKSAAPTAKNLVAVSATRLKLEYFTLAEAFKAAGYRTGHFGKWHLGREPYDPYHQGFDVDVPHWYGPGPAGSYVAPWKFPATLNFTGQAGEHIEDRMASEAVKFIRENKDRPFYMSYWCFSVHSPWGAKKELIEKYRAKADPKSPQRNPVYGAMVQSMDEAVGKLMGTLDELGLSDNTIIVFFSDNGGVHFAEVEGAPVTSNAPLRGGKATTYEGGTREPCIVVWPGVTKSGSTSDAVIQSIDFHPTLLEMTGLKPQTGQKFDGISIVPALQGKPLGRDTIFCHFPHTTPASGGLASTYVRKGDWKLIRFYHDNEDQTDRYELYNLKDDVSETDNVAEKQPDIVKELNHLIDGFLKETRAIIPARNPAYKRGAAAVEGWFPSPQCTLAAKGGALAIESTGSDPYIRTNDVPDASGALRVNLRMRSQSKGAGQLFWTTAKAPQFGPANRLDFAPQHDGQWHEYEIPFTAGDSLRSLRIDPNTAPGLIEIEWIRLCKEDGTVLKAWNFAEAAKNPSAQSPGPKRRAGKKAKRKAA